MKAILISIKPEWVCKILNGEKTIEVRKTAPKCELPVDVYIYCTKDSKRVWYFDKQWRGCYSMSIYDDNAAYEYFMGLKPLNGKVVAKFTLKKVERFIQGLNEVEYERLPNFALQDYDYHGLDCLMEKACLNDEEINEYAPDLSFYAWHISDLQIFDEPKEISEFKYEKKKVRLTEKYHWKTERLGLVPVKKAPQSWQYVEEKE